MVLCSGYGIPDVLASDPKFTSMLSKEFTRRIGSSLLIVSAYHKNTNARAERPGVNGRGCWATPYVQGFANGSKDDWDVWLPYAIFAINNAPAPAPSAVSGSPRLQTAGEPAAAYETWMKA
jgi:hypothetical protein